MNAAIQSFLSPIRLVNLLLSVDYSNPPEAGIASHTVHGIANRNKESLSGRHIIPFKSFSSILYTYKAATGYMATCKDSRENSEMTTKKKKEKKRQMCRLPCQYCLLLKNRHPKKKSIMDRSTMRDKQIDVCIIQLSTGSLMFVLMRCIFLPSNHLCFKCKSWSHR